MIQKIYQVDAFTHKVFSGNPAAVCPLEHWISDETLQNIAMENNLAETAYYVNKGEVYELRWFTPTVEVDLCGHATLATAYVLFHHENHEGNVIHFYSPRSGQLTVTKEEDLLTLNFPTDPVIHTELTVQMLDCFNIPPQSALLGKTDLLLIYNNEEEIRNLIPHFSMISQLNVRGVIVSAPGKDVDFVSRFFTPQCGVDEDPVTGSAHTTLTPFWSKLMNKQELTARQLSRRGGYLLCKNREDRVEISGQGRLYMKGVIYIS